MIEIANLGHHFGSKILFEGVTLSLKRSGLYGIVGANGSGKSTFLRIVAQELEADQGEVSFVQHPDIYRIGQDHNLDDQKVIVELVMMGQERAFLAIVRKKSLLEKPSLSDAESHELARIEEILEQSEAYRLKSRAQTVLTGLGIPPDYHEQPLKTLSGGYKWRVYLAQALVRSPDIFLLDEPTNHLDIVSIRWLEQLLQNYHGTVLIVSHDRRFLDNVCNHVLDVDFQTITPYVGNFTDFESQKKLFLEQKEKEIKAQQKEIGHKQAFIDRFRYKASKARQAQSRLKQIEKITIIQPIRSSRQYPHFRFLEDRASGKEVLEVKELNKAYGAKQVLSHINLKVLRKEHVAVIGQNGTGKSTLIKALAGEFSECQGSVRFRNNVSLGYFAQDCDKLIKESGLSALEWLWQYCPDQSIGFVLGMLGRIFLGQDEAQKKTSQLSGGELGRLYLAKLMIEKPNTLLLDEPTNHLDIESIEALTKALKAYEGTLIFVSHDRMFVSELATRILEVQEEGMVDFRGSYAEYVEKNHKDYLDRTKTAISQMSSTPTDKSQAGKQAYIEQKQRKSLQQKTKKNLEQVMLEVSSLENNLLKINELFLEPEFYEKTKHEEITRLACEKEALEVALSEKMDEWERLERELNSLGPEQ